MLLKSVIVAVGIMFALPAWAQTYNGFVQQPEYDFTSSNMSWSFYDTTPNTNATKVLQQLRARCESNRRDDQLVCRRGLKLLNQAYAEYKFRKSAESTVAE